jgi:hypothetical protein
MFWNHVLFIPGKLFEQMQEDEWKFFIIIKSLTSLNITHPVTGGKDYFASGKDC